MKNANWGKGRSSWNKGIPCSESTRKKIGKAMIGENSPNYGKREGQAAGWKDTAKKSAMHKWIIRQKGKANTYTCELCKKRKAMDWANKKHDYKRKESDYMALCRKCHKLHDGTSKLVRSAKNEIIDCGSHYKLCLENRSGQIVAFSEIDKGSLKLIKDFKWSLTTSPVGYVNARVNGGTKLLHAVIMNTPKGYVTDHIDHNKTDNRKQNLRIVTHSQNAMNSCTVGISWCKDNNNWRSYITAGGKQEWLGRFKEKVDAVIARRNAEKKFFGKYAYKAK